MEPAEPIKDSIPRVFVVGMNKTGTSSMKGCFEELGWLPVASPTTMSGGGGLFRDIVENSDYEPSLAAAVDYLAFEDRPWNVWDFYKHAAERFPDSRFILTRRDPASWWRSVERWLTVKKPDLVETYKVHLRAEAFTEGHFVSAYERGNDEIERFFEGSDRLLVVDVTAGDGWEQICPFLGVPVPEAPFPHRNKQGYRTRRGAKRPPRA